MTSMQTLWQNLIDAAKKAAPKADIVINNGTNLDAIKALEILIAKPLPQDFINSYLVCDGISKGKVQLFGPRLMPIAEIMLNWQSMKEIKASGAFMQKSKAILSEPAQGIKNDWWNDYWLPITDNMSGDYDCIDLDPTDEGVYGQVIRFMHDDAYRSLEAKSMQDWIEKTTLRIKNGELKYDADYTAFIDF